MTDSFLARVGVPALAGSSQRWSPGLSRLKPGLPRQGRGSIANPRPQGKAEFAPACLGRHIAEHPATGTLLSPVKKFCRLILSIKPNTITIRSTHRINPWDRLVAEARRSVVSRLPPQRGWVLLVAVALSGCSDPWTFYHGGRTMPLSASDIPPPQSSTPAGPPAGPVVPAAYLQAPQASAAPPGPQFPEPGRTAAGPEIPNPELPGPLGSGRRGQSRRVKVRWALARRDLVRSVLRPWGRRWPILPRRAPRGK